MMNFLPVSVAKILLISVSVMSSLLILHENEQLHIVADVLFFGWRPCFPEESLIES